MKALLSSLLLFITISSFAQSDTITIYFGIGTSIASDIELEKLQIQSNWNKVDIISYTDYLGSKEMNQRLSLYRSFEIRARLVEKGLNSELLGIVEGRGITGVTLDSKEGIQGNRKTDVIFYRTVQAKIEPEIIEEEPELELSDQILSSNVGDNLVLSDLSFIPGQHFLTASGDSSFVKLTNLLQENSKLKINIEGHICCNINGEDGLDLATNRYNLSEARAEYIYTSLIENGIDRKRLSYEGFARSKPIYPNELNEEEKKANRRVEIKILDK
ncbi:MAG: OmpA family protein [Flavobacteriales bacterium]|nr:OmpA family protein [Flavobacteriales bacterium]